MKKFILKSLLFIICLSILFNLKSIKTGATGNNINYSTEYVKLYYSHLYQNYLPNYTNRICGYQAFCNLLGYWDNYWDEAFISNNNNQKAPLLGEGFYRYESINSPGMRNISLPKTWVEDGDELVEVYDFSSLCDVSEASYEDKLLLLAAKTHFDSNYSLFGTLLHIVDYNNLINSFSPYVINTLHLDGLELDDAFDLYSDYFDYIEANNSFVKSNYTFTSVSGIVINNNQTVITDYRNQVISYLNDGYPVICMLIPYNEGTYNNLNNITGHFMVCYEYDLVNDRIYGHTDNVPGESASPHYDISSYNEDMSIAAYYVITPNNSLSHNCTWAYVDEDEYNNTLHYCPCFLLNHMHTYSGTQLQTEHICSNVECKFHEEHTGTYSPITNNSISHITHCETCGGDYIMVHDYEILGNLSICKKCLYRYKSSDIIIYKKEEEEIL